MIRVVGFLVAVLAMAATACSAPEGEGVVAPSAVTSVSVASTGQDLFATACAVCHGANGEGQPNWHIRKEDGTLPPPPLNGDGHTWHHADGLLYRIVSSGGGISGYESGMPAFGEVLSHQEIIDVLMYVKSLWGDKTFQGHSIRETQETVSENDPFPVEGS